MLYFTQLKTRKIIFTESYTVQEITSLYCRYFCYNGLGYAKLPVMRLRQAILYSLCYRLGFWCQSSFYSYYLTINPILFIIHISSTITISSSVSPYNSYTSLSISASRVMVSACRLAFLTGENHLSTPYSKYTISSNSS